MSSSTVQIKSRVTIQDLIEGVKQLSPSDLNEFILKVNRLHDQKIKVDLTQKERLLLEKINEKLPEVTQQRLEQLQSKKSEGELKDEEQEELLAIVDVIDDMNLERVRALKQLAELRGISVNEVMNLFKISQTPNV